MKKSLKQAGLDAVKALHDITVLNDKSKRQFIPPGTIVKLKFNNSVFSSENFAIIVESISGGLHGVLEITLKDEEIYGGIWYWCHKSQFKVVSEPTKESLELVAYYLHLESEDEG